MGRPPVIGLLAGGDCGAPAGGEAVCACRPGAWGWAEPARVPAAVTGCPGVAGCPGAAGMGCPGVAGCPAVAGCPGAAGIGGVWAAPATPAAGTAALAACTLTAAARGIGRTAGGGCWTRAAAVSLTRCSSSAARSGARPAHSRRRFSSLAWEKNSSDSSATPAIAANAAIAPTCVNVFESESASNECVMNPGSV